MRAVFLERESLDRGDLDLSGAEAAVDEIVYHNHTSADQVLERITGFEIVIANKVRVSRQDLEQARPKMIAVVATGVNNIDLDACQELGITVVNVRGYGTDSVAQHAIGLLLALATRLIDYHRDVQQGEWNRSAHFCLLDYPIVELAGKKLGVVGLGTLGGRTAELARALGMEVLSAQRPGGKPQPDRVPLDELLPQVDALTLHCPLTDDTRGLIGRRELAMMKPTAFIINTARGGLVDEEALVEALRQRRLGGAGFDVLTEEPPRSGNPLLDDDIPNLIVTPHSAWGSHEARQRICEQLAENIRGWRNGEPVRVVV
ncbi:glycerate dehydrogenase [Natronocella acetinitrilica]|uniref:Glycerate dehydrogenase n=1 Tax=Natronocella acetinitrilica TaxID=414046 RepID=A0AAE3KGE7_9GAMM|nr:2-hydroxyacid dehydrogenase [Natronocella acetinitrilica]MCP1675172.1 glycerate dehydrogenase [Natronocella acetinitrilica]